MKRTFAIVLAAVAAAAVFAGVVYAVLAAAHLSEPAATTVYGLTPRRLWATTVAVLALVGVVIGGLALAPPPRRFGTASRRLGALLAPGGGGIRGGKGRGPFVVVPTGGIGPHRGAGG